MTWPATKRACRQIPSVNDGLDPAGTEVDSNGHQRERCEQAHTTEEKDGAERVVAAFASRLN